MVGWLVWESNRAAAETVRTSQFTTGCLGSRFQEPLLFSWAEQGWVLRVTEKNKITEKWVWAQEIKTEQRRKDKVPVSWAEQSRLHGVSLTRSGFSLSRACSLWSQGSLSQEKVLQGFSYMPTWPKCSTGNSLALPAEMTQGIVVWLPAFPRSHIHYSPGANWGLDKESHWGSGFWRQIPRPAYSSCFLRVEI